MTRATFAFVREGTSDDGLIPHLSDLLVRAGLGEVVGTPREYKGTVKNCLELVAEEEAGVDVVFVHRDTDSPSDSEVRAAIESAIEELGDELSALVIPVVPIQELEAWLLLDETAIRAVAGKPSKRMALDLPRPARIEATSSPKEILQAALLTASDTTGRRYKDERRRFSEHRRTLLERLDVDGPIQLLSAWQSLERDVQTAARELLARCDDIVHTQTHS